MKRKKTTLDRSSSSIIHHHQSLIIIIIINHQSLIIIIIIIIINNNNIIDRFPPSIIPHSTNFIFNSIQFNSVAVAVVVAVAVAVSILFIRHRFTAAQPQHGTTRRQVRPSKPTNGTLQSIENFN
jgi:hypothetical protein